MSTYLVQIRKLNHVRKLDQVSVGVDILKRQNIRCVMLQVDDTLFALLGAASTVADDFLLIIVQKCFDRGLFSILLDELCRIPGVFLIENVNKWLSSHFECGRWLYNLLWIGCSAAR